MNRKIKTKSSRRTLQITGNESVRDLRPTMNLDGRTAWNIQRPITVMCQQKYQG